MKFCERHWSMMRAAVEARGMTPLVSVGGASAIEKMKDELATGRVTPDNFDPLMAMHWNIAGGLMEKLGASAGYLLGGPDAPEDPIDVGQIEDVALKAKYLGRTWPRCPICYANIAHELTCSEQRCRLARVNGWDPVVEWSADAVKEQFGLMMRGRT